MAQESKVYTVVEFRHRIFMFAREVIEKRIGSYPIGAVSKHEVFMFYIN